MLCKKEKMENTNLYKENFENQRSPNKNFSNSNINNTSYCNANLSFVKIIAPEMKLYFEKHQEPINYFISNVEELLIQNSKFIMNLYETRNQYDSCVIQKQISNLTKEFDNSLFN